MRFLGAIQLHSRNFRATIEAPCRFFFTRFMAQGGRRRSAINASETKAVTWSIDGAHESQAAGGCHRTGTVLGQERIGVESHHLPRIPSCSGEPRQRFALHPSLWLAMFAVRTLAVACGGAMLIDSD